MRVRRAVQILGAVLLTVALMEIGLRVISHPGRPFLQRHRESSCTRHPMEEDPVRGWRNRVGEHHYSCDIGTEKLEIRQTLWPGGFRATAPIQEDRPEKLLLVGCSCTYGLFLSDHETFGWKLQEAFPSVQVINAGVPGYSTVQALLTLRGYLEGGDTARVVLYSHISHHALRNVAESRWARNLSFGVGSVLPRVGLGSDGALRELPPLDLRRSLWIRHSYVLDLGQFAWARISDLDQETRRQAATLTVMRLQELARQHGATLAVAHIGHPDKESDREIAAFRRAGVDTVLDCRVQVNAENAAPADPGRHHGNADVHTAYSTCIAEGLASLLLVAPAPAR